MPRGKKLPVKREIGTVPTPRKQPEMNRYQPSKAVPTVNSFEGVSMEDTRSHT
jgi:hypothetical protein